MNIQTERTGSEAGSVPRGEKIDAGGDHGKLALLRREPEARAGNPHEEGEEGQGEEEETPAAKGVDRAAGPSERSEKAVRAYELERTHKNAG